MNARAALCEVPATRQKFANEWKRPSGSCSKAIRDGIRNCLSLLQELSSLSPLRSCYSVFALNTSVVLCGPSGELLI